MRRRKMTKTIEKCKTYKEVEGKTEEKYERIINAEKYCIGKRSTRWKYMQEKRQGRRNRKKKMTEKHGEMKEK